MASSNTTEALRIAVLSDLHCESFSGAMDNSFLKFGQPGIPSNQNPIESLIEVIHSEELSCDIVACPGDLTNRACPIGYHGAMSMLSRIQRETNAKHLVVVTGNHDIDSRRQTSPGEPFAMAKNFSRIFPFPSADSKNSYFSSGFALLDFGDCRFIAINSTADHIDEKTAERGTFNEARINDLDHELSKVQSSTPAIAMFHHHPTQFSLPSIGEDDILPTGAKLLDVLKKHRVRLAIHGHRHFGHINHVNTRNGLLPVFGAGSFSRKLDSIATYTRNLFHIVHIERTPLIPGAFGGWINTWEYNYAVGWKRATDSSAGLPFLAGFGCSMPASCVEEVKAVFDKHALNEMLYKEHLLREMPVLLRLIPSDWVALSDRLASEHGLIPFTNSKNGEFIGIAKIVTGTERS